MSIAATPVAIVPKRATIARMRPTIDASLEDAFTSPRGPAEMRREVEIRPRESKRQRHRAHTRTVSASPASTCYSLGPMFVPQVRDALVRALRLGEPIATAGIQRVSRPQIVWRRRADVWDGKWEFPVDAIPDVLSVWNDDSIIRPLEEACKEHQPDLAGTFIYFPGGGGRCIDARRLIEIALPEVRRQRETGALDPIAHAVDALGTALAKGTIHFELKSAVTGVRFEKSGDEVRFPDNIVLRQVSEEEVNEFARSQFGLAPAIIPDAIFVGEYEQEFCLTTTGMAEMEDRSSTVLSAIDRAVRAMCTFKDGSVSPNIVQFRASGPLSHGTISRGGSGSRAFSSYSIATAEISSLETHAKRLGRVEAWPALDIALSRLVEASNRQNPRDAVLDAVTGLEILLSQGRDEREGLRYRFAVHYATLAPYAEREERCHRFREAYDLYLVRSTAVHAGTAAEKFKFANDQLSLSEISTRARAMLRETICRFLDEPAIPASKKDRVQLWSTFWERQLFGLGD